MYSKCYRTSNRDNRRRRTIICADSMFDPCKFIPNAEFKKRDDDIKSKGNGTIQ